MSGLFSSAPATGQASGSGWFPTPNWPGTDVGPQMRENLQNSTRIPRQSPRRGADVGVIPPEKNPAFRPAKGEKVVAKKNKEELSPTELKQMYDPDDEEMKRKYYTDVYGRQVESITGTELPRR